MINCHLNIVASLEKAPRVRVLRFAQVKWLTMIVWISGPTGAGKSSLATILRALGCAIVQENLPAERFRAFAADPSAHCASLQEDIMRSRFQRWREISSMPRIIFDRSIDEDAQVFCRMHRELRVLDSRQYKGLQNLAQELQSAIPAPDLILFMCPDRRVLTDRVTETSHPPLIVDSLDRQLSLYAEWLAARHEDILKVDNSNCSLQAVELLLSEDRPC